MRRRDFLWGAAAIGAAGASPLSALAKSAQSDPAVQIARLEGKTGGRLGVAAWDTRSGRHIDYRPDERFAMASTVKLLLAAHILSLVEKGSLRLDQMVRYTSAALLPNSPVTSAHVEEGALSLETLAKAAVEVSDNTAANLLFARSGGPQGLTQFLRYIGDEVTRSDRTEMSLGTNRLHDARDTTTPAQMIATLHTLLVDKAFLQSRSRERLLAWMIACKTGKDRLRAGLPKSWTAGDKTGTGANASVNDVAIAWRFNPKPNAGEPEPPILIACYMDRSHAAPEALNAAHAEVGRIVARAFGEH